MGAVSCSSIKTPICKNLPPKLKYRDIYFCFTNSDEVRSLYSTMFPCTHGWEPLIYCNKLHPSAFPAENTWITCSYCLYLAMLQICGNMFDPTMCVPLIPTTIMLPSVSQEAHRSYRGPIQMPSSQLLISGWHSQCKHEAICGNLDLGWQPKKKIKSANVFLLPETHTAGTN